MNPESIRASIALAVAVLLYGAVLWWMILSNRRWSRKVNIKRRLLVIDQDGQLVWRSMRGRVLVGWLDGKGVITSGHWATFESDERGSD